MGQFKYYLILTVLGVITTYSRLEGIIAGTFGFTHDQGRDLIIAQQIANGHPTLIGPTSGLAGLFHGPIWYYILAFFSKIGGGDPKAVLIGIVFMFLAAEIFLFWTVKKFHGIWPASILLIFMFLSPRLSSLNGQLWSPSMIIFSSMIMIAAIVAILNGKSWYWLLGLALGVNLQFEIAGGTFLLLVTLIILLLLKPFSIKIRSWLILLLSFMATLLPQAIFELRHGFLMTEKVLSYLSVKNNDFIAPHGIKSIEYKSGLFFDTYNSLFFKSNVDFGILLLAVIFYLTYKALSKNKKFNNKTKSLLYISLSYIFFLWVIVNFYTDVVWAHFVYGISVFILIIIVLLLDHLRHFFPLRVYSLSLLIISYLIINIFFNLNKQKNIEGDYSYFRNKLNVIDKIYSDAGAENFNVVIYEPTTFSYTYDYLFSWYGRKKYRREPISNEYRVRTAYYFLEPDGITGRKEKWLKEREGEGEIVWEYKYKDGSIMQKRIRPDI